MKKILVLLLMLPVLTFSGCMLMLIGGAATGGYALSSDSAEGILDVQYDKIWDTAYKVFEEDGVITIADEQHGRIEAEVDGVNMNVHIDRVGKESVRLKITARQYMMPKAKQAEAEFVKIQNRL